MSHLRPPSMFEDVSVIGELPADEAASKLHHMGDLDAAGGITQRSPHRRGITDLFDWGAPKPWRYTTHQFGYIAPIQSGGSAPLPIHHPGAITADETLRNSRINVHLDRLRIFDYPGSGLHHVMVTFKAQNQLPATSELVSFSHTYRVQQGQLAGIAGYPVFIGLSVGNLGAAFQGFTVNVRNDADKAFLDLLESPSFQNGLNLLTGVQPVIKPFTDMTLGIARTLAKRNENVAVQDFYLGLDFTPSPFGARIAEGNYLAVQVPSETTINWEEWVFSPTMGAIARAANSAESLPFNYIIFRVTRHHEAS